MSLPSITKVAEKLGVNLKEPTTVEQQEMVLVEAMRLDLPLAVEFLHRKAHEADESGGTADWLQDPKSPIGQQLIRLHASDALRPLASKHFCHGKELTFVNCCGGRIGRKPENILLRQIESQAGPTAFSDC